MTGSTLSSVPGAPAHLGRPIKVYRQGRAARIVFVVRFVTWLALVVGIGVFSYQLLLRGLGWTRFQKDAWQHLAALASILALVGWVSIPVLRRFLDFLQEWEDIAVQYAEGIAYRHAGAWRAMSWEEIDEVRQWSEPVAWGWEGSELVFLPILMIRALLAGRPQRYGIGGSGGIVRVSGTLNGIEEFIGTVRDRCEKGSGRAPEKQIGSAANPGPVDQRSARRLVRGRSPAQARRR